MQHIFQLQRSTLRTKRFTMDSVAVPSDATIYIGKFENTYIYTKISYERLFYARFLDSILITYFCTEAKLNQTMHESIKFDHEKSTFLDTQAYIGKNRQLQTTLYTKPTNALNYLHYRSSHTKLLKNSLPTSSAIRLRIIIIKSCRQHGYPWPSLATSPYHSSLLAGLQAYIPYPHITAVCMFELVVLLLLGHMRGSIGVHHWWVRPCFSSSVLRVWFV